MATIELTEATFAETIARDSVVLVDFWAPWCGPSRTFGPVYEKVSESHQDVTFAKVNTEVHPGLAGTFKIRSLPTLLAFRRGVMLFSQSGMLPEKSLGQIAETIKKLDR